jgi:hypothetical protein
MISKLWVSNSRYNDQSLEMLAYLTGNSGRVSGDVWPVLFWPTDCVLFLPTLVSFQNASGDSAASSTWSRCALRRPLLTVLVL